MSRRVEKFECADSITGGSITDGTSTISSGGIDGLDTEVIAGIVTPTPPPTSTRTMYVNSGTGELSSLAPSGNVQSLEEAPASLARDYGEKYFNQQTTDYSSFGILSDAAWTTIQVAGSIGIWYQVASGFSSGRFSGVTLGLNSITINTTGVYLVTCELTGNVDGTGAASQMELAFTNTGSAPPASTATTFTVSPQIESATSDDRPIALKGSRLISLTATQVITLWFRWVTGIGGTRDIKASRVSLKVRQLS